MAFLEDNTAEQQDFNAAIDPDKLEGLELEGAATLDSERKRDLVLMASVASLDPNTSGSDVPRELDAKKKQLSGLLNTEEDEDGFRKDLSRLRGVKDAQTLEKEVGDIIGTNSVLQEDNAALIETFISSREALLRKQAYDDLEIQALENARNLSLNHPEYLHLAAMAATKGEDDASDVIKDMLERTAIIDREAKRAAQEHQDSNIVSRALNMVASFVPFNELMSTDKLPGADYWSFVGSRERDAGNTLYDMPREEFNRVYPEVFATLREQSGVFFGAENPLIMQEVLTKLIGISDDEVMEKNIWDAVDAVGLIPVGKLVTSVKAALARGASRPAAADNVAAAVRTEASEGAVPDPDNLDTVAVTADEATQELQPSALSPNWHSDASISAAIDYRLEQGREVIRNLREAQGGRPDVIRATAEETEAAFDATRVKLLEKYGSGTVADFYTEAAFKSGTMFTNGTAKVGFKIGRTDGHPFATEKSATQAAKRKGLLDKEGKGGVSIVKHEPSGGWFIHGQADVVERSFVSIDNAKGLSDGTVVGTFLRSSAALLPDLLQRRAVAAGFNKSAIHHSLKPILKNIGGLSKRQRQSLDAVWKRGRDTDRKWYNADEFSEVYANLHQGRLPSEKEILNYFSLRQLNDFEYHLRNHAQYTKRVQEGYVTGKLELPGDDTLSFGERNLKPMDTPPVNMNRMTVYDAHTNEILSGDDIPRSVLEQALKDTSELYRIGDSDVFFNGVPVSHVLVPKGRMVTRPLEYRQVKYSEGGHRIYADTIRVQQARLGSFTSRTGRTVSYVAAPKTNSMFPTTGTAQEWADSMERARQAYVRNKAGEISDVEAGEILRNEGFQDGIDEFKKGIDDGYIMEDQPFEVVQQGEFPSVHKKKLLEDGTLDLVQEGEDGVPDWLADQGMMYYSTKGAGLPSPQGGLVTTVDFMETANRAAENAMSMAGAINYKVNAVQRWMKTFGHLLPHSDSSSDIARFWSESIDTTKGDKVARQADRARKAIQNQLGHPSKLGRGWQHAVTSLANWVEPVAGTKVTKRILDTQDSDPIAALKGISFDSKLGLFDPSQLIVQTQTAFAMVTVDPLNAPKFIRDMIPLRAAIINPKLMDKVAKYSSFEDPEEFKAMAKAFRKSGSADPSGELIIADQYPGVHASMMGKSFNSIRQRGRMFFYEAERINRVYAWRKAWNDQRNKGISVEDMTGPENVEELKRLTDLYTLNMIRESGAAWQKGILSVPTQFLSYQARFIENILPEFAGGSKNWTSGQKLAMLGGQLFLYGAGGIPLGRTLLEHSKAAFGMEFEEDDLMSSAAHRQMIGGIFDSTIYAITGGEVDMAFEDRAAIMGKGVEELWAKLNADDFSATGFLGVLGGAPFGVLADYGSDLANGLHNIFLAASTDSTAVTTMTLDSVGRLAANISTFSRAQKAYWVLNYGQWISGETGKALAKATPSEAVIAALGIQPRDLAEARYLKTRIDDQKEYNREVAKTIKRLQLEAIRARATGDEDTAQEKFKAAIAIGQVHDPVQRLNIAKAGRNLPIFKDYSTEITQQYMRLFRELPSRQIAKPNTQ